MVNDYESLIIPVFIGAMASIIVNIIYYEYKFSKEKKFDFLKMQITELLLPLYIYFNNIEKELMVRKERMDSLIEILSKDIDIKKIPTDKLYLASPKLSHLLLDFLDFQYVLERRLSSYTWVVDDAVLKNYEELKQAIFEEYKQKVDEYQRKFKQK